MIKIRIEQSSDILTLEKDMENFIRWNNIEPKDIISISHATERVGRSSWFSIMLVYQQRET